MRFQMFSRRLFEALETALARMHRDAGPKSGERVAEKPEDAVLEPSNESVAVDPAARPPIPDATTFGSPVIVPQSPLEEEIVEALSRVIDPETFIDVLRMGLIRELHAGDDGHVNVTFRPSSPVCPLAFKLGADIQEATEKVEGVKQVLVKVEDFVHAEQLMAVLNG